MSAKPIVAIGLGNSIMSDEGIGVRLLAELAAKGDKFPDVEFIDLGTSGIRVLHAIAGRRKAVILDCAFMNEAPGTIRRFAPEQAVSVKRLGGSSLHESDLLATLALSRRLGECPSEVVIVGIEPETVEPGLSLSPELERRMPEYVSSIRKELASSDG